MALAGVNLVETEGHIFLLAQPLDARAPVDVAMLRTLLTAVLLMRQLCWLQLAIAIP